MKLTFHWRLGHRGDHQGDRRLHHRRRRAVGNGGVSLRPTAWRRATTRHHRGPRRTRSTVTVTLSADPERTVTIPIREDRPGRGVQRGLLGSASQRHLQQQATHREDLHVHGNVRQRRRRRGVCEADLRKHPANEGTTTRPVSINDDDLPWTWSSSQSSYTVAEGEHRDGEGDPERGPRADGDHRDHQGRSRAARRAPTTRECPPA